jgi:outer membrane protein OmpA-like peptidoglycan-associated protein
MVVAADGTTAFYDSDRGSSLGGLDIYSFQLPADVKATKTKWVRGRVYDKLNKAGLPSTVELTDINTRILVSRLKTDEDGNYLITLPEGKSYAFHVNRKGYLLYSAHYDFDGSSNDSVFIADIPLEPFSIGAAVILQNIFFANNAYSLNENSFPELDKIVALLQENPQLKIQVSGHTDNVGKKESNMLLSTNRAKAVMAYFLNHGIVADRLSAKGFADMKPIASNDTNQGKSLNRRTEINVTSF